MHLEAGRRVAGGEGVVELGEQAAREAHDAHHAVFDAALRPMPPREVIAVTRLRLVVEHEAQRVGVVHGDVEHHAAAGLRAR